jgi:cytochrome b6-f complex iron-sulfur subunit
MALNPYDTPRGRLQHRVEATRRQFLLLMGGLGALGATIFGSVEVLKFMFPGATNDAPAQFKTDITFTELTGGIDPSTKKPMGGANVVAATQAGIAKRVNLVVDDAGIYAVYLVCTHLGCTPNYFPQGVTNGTTTPDSDAKSRGARSGAEQVTNGWECPCHGSRYFVDSTNFYGPAPRPMDWIDVQVAPDDHFVVDRGKLVVVRNAGDATAPQWRLLLDTKKSNGKTLGV